MKDKREIEEEIERLKKNKGLTGKGTEGARAWLNGAIDKLLWAIDKEIKNVK